MKTSPHSLVCTFFNRDTGSTVGRAGRQMHEAFETNNWYNDISTRDKSREGAEEAIDLS